MALLPSHVEGPVEGSVAPEQWRKHYAMESEVQENYSNKISRGLEVSILRRSAFSRKKGSTTIYCARSVATIVYIKIFVQTTNE